MPKYVIAECPYCGWFWVPRGQNNGRIEPYRIPTGCPACKKRFKLEGMPEPAGIALQMIKLHVKEFANTNGLQKFLYENRKKNRES